ncbi:hypothetical protein PISL3812_01224 [Talaromyces islandicus]|uniref:Amine oxidase domain-containing protein n=1 Tax=Talaromyces islandicus TaxID=28573 RepID=A0A0U1LLJ5_TALIS|nr:hypothetical protein PISL3812_01224 [Talaromyces islandicus]
MAPNPSHSPPKRVAIVGGGIAGISCLWGLREEESTEVHLYEADDRLGGHANSVAVKSEDGKVHSVDTGFVTMSESMYPKFNAFLNAIDVPTMETDMSFGVMEDDGSVEWGSCSFAGFYGTVSRLFTLWFWRLVFDIIRFNFFATDILSEKVAEELKHTSGNEKSGSKKRKLESIGEYLDRKHYSDQFKQYYLFPMIAAPWCMSLSDVANGFPAETLVYFMYRHRMLDTMTETLSWRAFKNGSKTYVDKFVETTPENHHYHLNTPVQSIIRNKGDEQASLIFKDGSVEVFDHVVLAVHAHQALDLLGEQSTSLEKDVLGAFRTSRNECVMHSDLTFLPKNPKAHASWICHMPSKVSSEEDKSAQKPEEKKPLLDNDAGSDGPVSVLFDMNRLQEIPGPGLSGSPGRILISMNPIRTPQSIRSQHLYYHPILDSPSIQASRDLNVLNRASPNISFAGAWMGYGFHEDGFAAGLDVSHKLLTGEYETQSSVRYGADLAAWVPKLSTRTVMVRSVIGAVQLLIEWVGFSR